MTTYASTFTVICPECGGGHVKKVGMQAGHQRYQCHACNKKFRHGIEVGKRIPAEQVGHAVRSYYMGMSYKQIAEAMADAYDIPEPSKATIYEWVREYTDKATKAMRDHKADVGDSWVADEMMVDVGGEKMWNWNVMDEKTRYILASHLSRTRTAGSARATMRKAMEAAKSPPKTIKTDKLRSYTPALKDYADIEHVQSQGMRAELNNNLSERLQGTYRARIKTLRGLDTLESGQRYLDGWTLTYNLFREHESLGDKTPGSKTLPNAPFEEWADVVRGGKAKQKPSTSVVRVPEGTAAPKAPLKPPKLEPQISLTKHKESRRGLGDRPIASPPRRAKTTAKGRPVRVRQYPSGKR